MVGGAVRPGLPFFTGPKYKDVCTLRRLLRVPGVLVRQLFGFGIFSILRDIDIDFKLAISGTARAVEADWDVKPKLNP